jgi:hypothetical protein
LGGAQDFFLSIELNGEAGSSLKLRQLRRP